MLTRRCVVSRRAGRPQLVYDFLLSQHTKALGLDGLALDSAVSAAATAATDTAAAVTPLSFRAAVPDVDGPQGAPNEPLLGLAAPR